MCDIDDWGLLLKCLKVSNFFSPEIDKFLNENIMRDFLIGVYYWKK